jgi:CheY-like chemotaxis protein
VASVHSRDSREPAKTCRSGGHHQRRQGDIVDALRAGINSYVVKPFTPDIIKQKIEAMLAA